MQKFLIYPQPGKVDILNDDISAFRPYSDFYVLDKTPVEKQYDFILASAHDKKAFSYKGKAKLILVVSYVPHVESKEWPGFYVNVCMADCLAMDRFVHDLFSTITLPEKRIIYLDACSPANQLTKVPLTLAKDKISLVNLDVGHDNIWNLFSEYVIQNHMSDFIIEKRITKDSVGVSFNGIGGALATNLSYAMRFVSTPYSPHSLLDTRCFNTVKSKMGNLINMEGAAKTQVAREIFKDFVETLQTLLEHAEKKPLLRFSSNLTVFDRIFFELNRAT